MTYTFIAVLVFVVIPLFLIFLPFFWYGQRHSWGLSQYGWIVIGFATSVGAMMYSIWGFPIDALLIGVALPGLPMSLALIGVTRVQKSKSINKTKETIIWGVVVLVAFVAMLAIAVLDHDRGLIYDKRPFDGAALDLEAQRL